MHRLVSRAGLAALALLAACATRPAPVHLDVHPAAVDLPEDPVARDRGEVLVRQVAVCTECHGEDLAGKTIIAGFPMGRVTGSNLTTLSHYEPVDWVRAVRHGVKPDGTAILLMPVHDYAGLTEQDLGDMVVYLESLRPREREVKPIRLGPVGRMLVKKGEWAYHGLEVDHEAPVPQDQGARGAYLARVGSCMGCHAGGVGKGFGPGQPRSSNITPHPEDGIGAWSQADFDRVMREGVGPDGEPVDPFMPWQAYASWPQEDLDALFTWLMAQEPRPTPAD